MQNIIDRFIKYITIDTQSDPNNPDFPSTEKQWNLAKILVDDLKSIGVQDITLDGNCYIMATLPSNVSYQVPTIGFIAHIDTSPDYTGTNVNPQIHHNYDGKDIILNKAENIILSPDYFEDLLLYKGQTLITTDGMTLLGADDKAGITEIMTAMEYLIKHPEIKHGEIKIAFTPDEEVGKGAHLFDVEKFGAEWAYSMLIANKFITALPKDEIPQETEGYEGFYHLHTMKGEVEKTELHYIIRDHDMKLFEQRKVDFQKTADNINEKLKNDAVEVEIKDQYYNMREKVEPVMHIVDIAEESMKELGIKPLIKAIRGGTDGSQLSYKGLPCPNIFAGGHNFHGRYEYVPVESMQKATEVIVKIAELTAKKYKN
jgi:tripeptide aminopeptidase